MNKYMENLNKMPLSWLKNLKTKYENSDNNCAYFNSISVLNMREDSHTEALAYLLDVKNKESLQYSFTKMFLQNDDLNLKDIGIKDDTILDRLISTLKVEIQKEIINENNQKNGQIDIFMISEELKFVCIIEVKLDAKTSVNRENLNQLIRYRSYLDRVYKDYNKCLIYLCSAVDKQVQKNQKVKTLIEQNNYKVVEHSDVALFLYKILKDKPVSLKEHNKTTVYLLKEISQYLKGPNLNKINVVLNSIENNKSILDVPILDSILEKNLNYVKPKNCNIPLISILKINNENFVEKFFRQYVEYWEFSNRFTCGYSKIIDGYYMYDVLNKLKENKE